LPIGKGLVGRTDRRQGGLYRHEHVRDTAVSSRGAGHGHWRGLARTERPIVCPMVQTRSRMGGPVGFSLFQAPIGCKSERIWAKSVYRISSPLYTLLFWCSARRVSCQGYGEILSLRSVCLKCVNPRENPYYVLSNIQVPMPSPSMCLG
jgi:hypothetical protein